MNKYFFSFITSHRTILTSGDSGSGLFIELNNIFYLKGIVSSSLFDHNRDCDVTNFALYTDVLKFTEWIRNPKRESRPKCGTMSFSKSLIQGGSFASREVFPWTVAVYNTRVTPDKTFYLITGTLISNRHVIVAASFLVFKMSNNLKRAENFLMFFGAFDLDFEINSYITSTGVSRVIAHENYNRDQLPKVQVQPACLPTPRANSNDILISFGYVAGWGFDERQTFSTKKKMIQMKVDSLGKCYSRWWQQLARIKFSKYFCASSTSTGTPCTADGPLYIKSGNKWNLRGLLVINGTCNPANTLLFEDVAFYSRWIEEKMLT